MIAVLALAVVAGALVVWRQAHPPPPTIAIRQFQIIDPPVGQENFPDGLRTYLKSKLEIAGIQTAEAAEAAALLSGQLHPKDGGFEVTIQLTRASDGAQVWDWSFEVPRDAEMPAAGQDDARRYLNLSADVLVTR